MRKKIAVIGGGASGMMAAVTAARAGADVTVFERNDRVGKKLLATGNGKCNLGNRVLSAADYHSGDQALVAEALKRFGTEETERFFEGLGLLIKEKNGYLYPLCEQASAVLDVLRFSLEREGVRVVTQARVSAVVPKRSSRKERGESGFEVVWAQQREAFDRVILACGSKAAPKTGSDGSGYQLAEGLGLTKTAIVPALVQLKCREEFCRQLAGVRAEARIRFLEGDRVLAEETGELQLTEYGISGIPVFQASGLVNRRLLLKKEVRAEVDFLPRMEEEEWERLFYKRRARLLDSMTAEEFFTGLLHKKLMLLFLKLADIRPAQSLLQVTEKQLLQVMRLCRCLTFHIVGSNSYDSAQICAGGISMDEVTGELAAVRVPGLYLAGELLDVDGRCGGYNLQWAWTSGCLAGQAAAGGAVSESRGAQTADRKSAGEKAGKKAAQPGKGKRRG